MCLSPHNGIRKRSGEKYDDLFLDFPAKFPTTTLLGFSHARFAC